MVIPYLGRDDVSAALSSLIHASGGTESTGLEHLLLVDLRVASPDMPAGDAVRRFAVRELLVGEITNAVAEIRFVFELDPPDAHASLVKELAALEQNIATGSHELIAWCVLYERFVRADLSFTVERLAELLAVHKRTIARYTDEGIDLLTHRLIGAEQQARRQHLQRRLYAQLPYSVPLRVVGREAELRSAEEALRALSPRHLLITGDVGIGKTTFVQELVRRQIDAGDLDHLVWLSRPGSVHFIRQHLTEALLAQPVMTLDEQITLRDYLLLYRVAVVLDEVEPTAFDPAALADLLRDLGAAFVCLISRTGAVFESNVTQLHLTRLARPEAEEVVHDTLRLNPGLNADDGRLARDLYDHVGGNPLALRLAAGLWNESEDWRMLESGVHERLMSRLFAGFGIEERHAWAVLALCPSPVTIADVASLWDLHPGAVAALVRLSLVDQSETGSVMLVGAARAYIRAAYASSGAIRQLLHDLLTALDASISALEVIEDVLLTGFPEVAADRRRDWISRLWSEGTQRGHWARWRIILESYLQDSVAVAPDIRIAYGVCLRHLADWEGAGQVFSAVVAECGREGRFAEQARALSELSILTRNQGDYRQSLNLIHQARRYAQRLRDTDLLHALARHEARILIHVGDAAAARKLLIDLPETTPNLTLQSEALLASRDHGACRSVARRALRLIENDFATEASLYTIVGRSYEREGDHTQAHAYLTDAVTLLERGDDPFTLARAQTNLAAVLIPMRRFQDAGTLLSRAEAIQLQLGDRVGLSATRHNRTILGGHIAG